MTAALGHLARVQVLHLEAGGRSGVPRLGPPEHEGNVTRVKVTGPPGGWGLRAVVRGLVPHVPATVLLLAHAPVPAGVVAARTGRPYAVVLHGIDVFGTQQRLGTRPVRRLSLEVLEGAGAIVTVSDRVRRALPGALAGRAHVVHNGVDLATFHARGRVSIARPPRLLSVGNIGPRKGHDVVVEALPGLITRFPGLHWDIVGEGPLRGALERRAQQLGVDRAVTLTGSLAPHEVAERMRASHVFVLPATYEALGCVFLEAMACGLPVVATRGEGIGEVLRHGIDGLLVDAEPRDVCDAVTGLLALPERAEEIGSEAARRAAEFDWRRRAQELWDVVGGLGR